MMPPSNYPKGLIICRNLQWKPWIGHFFCFWIWYPMKWTHDVTESPQSPVNLIRMNDQNIDSQHFWKNSMKILDALIILLKRCKIPLIWRLNHWVGQLHNAASWSLKSNIGISFKPLDWAIHRTSPHIKPFHWICNNHDIDLFIP